jgi:FKBP-type peptidyl-prolyl cis-trans isomerase
MNKNVILATVCAAALSLTTACEKKLDTDNKRASYAIGQQIGTNLKNQNIDFDPDVVAQSLKDVVAGKPSKLKPEEMQQALQKLQEGVNKKQEDLANKNLADAKTFLEKNKNEAGVKTTASGLQYVVEKEGTGKAPTAQDVVKAHYKGTLTSGSQFDSSYDRGQPAEFPVGGVIKGWQEALPLMKVGAKYKLFVPPELGYGSAARPGIPANSVLVFEVELLDVKAGAKSAAAPSNTKKK